MNWTVLKNKNFRLLLLREGVGVFGNGCLQVVMALYMLWLTGSAAGFAAVLSLAVIPHLVLGPFAGAWVDRLDKRKLLMMVDGMRCILLAGAGLWCIGSTLPAAGVYGVVITLAICDLLAVPAFLALLPAVVEKEKLVDANALDTFMVETLKVMAPLAGTALYGWWGVGAVCGVNGLAAGIAFAAAWRMELPRGPKTGHKKTAIWQEMMEGCRVFGQDIRLSSLVVNGLLTHIFLFPFVMVGFPYMVKLVFGGTDLDFGQVESFQPMGAMMAVFLVGLMQKRFSISVSIGIGILGMTLAVAPLLLLGSSVADMLIRGQGAGIVMYFGGTGFLLWLTFTAYVVFFRSFYLQAVRPDQLGLFASLMAALFSAGRLIGFKGYGILLDQMPLIWSVGVLGIGMLLKLLVHIPFLLRDWKESVRKNPSNDLAEPGNESG